MSWPTYARADGEAPRSPAPPLATPGPHGPPAARAHAAVLAARPAPPPPPKLRARWSKAAAFVGDEVELICEIEGAPPPKLRFAIFEHDDPKPGEKEGQHDFVKAVEAKPEGGACRIAWNVEAIEDRDDAGSEEEVAKKGYTLPEFFFVVTDRSTSADSGKAKGALLEVKDVIDQPFFDALTGAPMPGRRFVLTLCDGRKVEGELDADSRAKVENVPPGPIWFRWVGGELEPFASEAGEWVAPDAERPLLAFHAHEQQALAAAAPRFIASTSAAPPTAEEGGSVELRAVVHGFANGAAARFRIYKLAKGTDPDQPVAEVDGAVEGGRATARWTVTGASGSGEAGGRAYADFDLDVEIDGVRFRSLETAELRAFAKAGPRTKRAHVLRVLVQVDPDDPKSADDTVTLKGPGGYEKRLAVVADGQRSGCDAVTLRFEGVEPGGRYSCIADPGKEGPPYYLFRDALLTEEDLR